MKKIFHFALCGLAVLLLATGCQKMDRPGMGEYPEDVSAPGGPLKFYAAFDGTSTDPLRNAVDSMRANFASDNPLASVDGINGKAIKGEPAKFIKYTSFNDWAQSTSFSISFWLKKDGQTLNNSSGNGPEYVFSIRASKNPDNTDYHWSNAIAFLLFEGNNTACALKLMVVNPSSPTDINSAPADKWFEWAGGESLAGLLDNQWHHIALTYDEASSGMKLYVDGVANPIVKTWNGHGKMRMSVHKAAEYRVGRGPRIDSEGDGAAGWLQSSLKGSLDQLRMYSTVLTQAEVTELFTKKL